MTKTVTDSTFDAEVLESGKPVLVEFGASWCGPCRMMAPVLDQIATENENIVVAKIDIDENPVMMNVYEIKSVPTMILFTAEGEVWHGFGAMPKAKVMSEIADYL